jgi:hypothetical protein
VVLPARSLTMTYRRCSLSAANRQVAGAPPPRLLPTARVTRTAGLLTEGPPVEAHQAPQELTVDLINTAQRAEEVLRAQLAEDQ